MKPTGHRRLLFNALGNVAGLVASLAVSLLLAPIVLRALGDARYGAWSFTESFIAYLTLFDLGIAAALVRFTPRTLARDDHEELSRIYSASLIVFLAGAVIALVIGAAFELLFLDRFLQTPELSGEFRWLFRILVLNFALSFPMSVFPAMLDGLGRFAFKSAIRTSILAIRVVFTLIVIRSNDRMIGLGLVITACTLLENLILAIAVRRALPGLRFRPWSVNREALKQIAGYSRHAFTAMLAGRLAFHTDAFVITPILGPAAFTIFSIPSRLVEMGKSLLRYATTTLTPAFSALEAREDHSGIRATFLNGTRAAWYAALPLEAGLLILGYPFLLVWVDLPYARACMPVLVALAVPLALTIAQSVASRVLYGTGNLKAFARATLAEGLSNLVLSLALIGPLGVTGVAIGTAIPHGLFCLWVIAFVCRNHGVYWSDYLATTIKPLAATAVPIVIWAVLGARGIDRWMTLFAVGAAGVLAYAIAVAILEGSMPAMRWLRARRGKLLPHLSPLRAAG